MLTGARTAAAASTWVMLQRGPSSGAFAEEVVHRARGELTADGFDVEVVDGPSPVDRVAEVTRAGWVHGADLAAGVFVEGDHASIDLVLVDERTGRSVERHFAPLPSDSSRAVAGEDASLDAPAVVLARRTVDLLRSSLLAFLVETFKAERHGPPLPRVPRDEEAHVDGNRARWAVEAGLAVVTSFEGVGPALLPMARLGYAATRTLGARITGTWLGTQPTVSTAAGSATVEQGVALLEGTARPWSKGWFHTALSVGVGTYYVAVDGSGYGASAGRRGRSFTLAADAGAAIGVHLDPQLELRIEVHALLATPGVAIRFLGDEVARLGRPSMLVTLTVAGWL